MPTAEELSRYADVALKVGLGLAPGDRLVVSSSIDARDFTELIVETAYANGALNVDVIWADDAVTRARYTHGSAEAAGGVSGYGHLLNAMVEGGDHFLQVKADDPDLLADQDPELVSRHQKANSDFIEPFNESRASLRTNWTILAAPTAPWARSIFPDLSEVEAVDRLWGAILRTCRIDETDPVAAWEEHIRHLAARSSYLNGKGFDSLRYDGPGTALQLGLPAGHRWLGGQVMNRKGVGYVPNLPTEEVFTSPDRLRGEGTVTATKPLSLFGTLVEGFGFEVAGGRIVGAHAKRGEGILEKALDLDDGSARFGEASLVPQSSRVAREDLIWQNMLFDENDACHIAFGRGFSLAVEGGTDLGRGELTARGINDSSIHVDFVVGSSELDIYGVAEDGKEELILAGGEWAFEV